MLKESEKKADIFPKHRCKPKPILSQYPKMATVTHWAEILVQVQKKFPLMSTEEVPTCKKVDFNTKIAKYFHAFIHSDTSADLKHDTPIATS